MALKKVWTVKVVEMVSIEPRRPDLVPDAREWRCRTWKEVVVMVSKLEARRAAGELFAVEVSCGLAGGPVTLLSGGLQTSWVEKGRVVSGLVEQLMYATERERGIA